VTPAPRLVVAGMAGDSGKTLVSLALVLAARDRGFAVRAFKKGPDYIDAAWLAWASGEPARNLDTFLSDPAEVARAFQRRAVRRTAAGGAINIIEGNRGLFDGLDAGGTHSTAALARLLGAPVLLVLNARKMTGTAAALVRGCQALDPGLAIAGVILNQVAGRRHETVAREAIERACGVTVVGAMPRFADPDLLPGRHLGLVTPREHGAIERVAGLLRSVARDHLDIDAVFAAVGAAPDAARSGEGQRDAEDGPGGSLPAGAAAAGGAPSAGRLTIGYLSDSAFSFYYPENLEALEARGAALAPLSSLSGEPIPPGLAALYIGGGFPETHAASLEGNGALLESLRAAAAGGLPIYAECGGLMLLANSVTWQGRRHAMAGVLDVEVEVCAAPQGHGYVVLSVDRPNPFFAVGQQIRAHEFHYSRIVGAVPGCACAVLRGTGCGAGRDAIVVDSVWASYAHVHAAGLPEWADGMVGAARRYRERGGGRTGGRLPAGDRGAEGDGAGSTRRCATREGAKADHE
jgi:cobyrinic acid a,c-diamide synthase